MPLASDDYVATLTRESDGLGHYWDGSIWRNDNDDSPYIDLSQTTGDAEPRPGLSIFQRMFLVSLHAAGGLAVDDTPVACGPRHCGQNRSAGGCADSGRHRARSATAEVTGAMS